MADDFEYTVLSDPDVAGFFTGPVDSQGNFLSEEIAAQATAQATAARRQELREIKRLRGVLDKRRRSGNIAASTYDRGNAILDSRRDALERVAQPAAVTLPEPLSPYSSPMMDSLPGEESKPLPAPVKVPLAKASGPGHGNWRDSPRQQAKREGRTHYFSNHLCPRKHQSARYTSTGQCVECVTNWNARSGYIAQKRWRERQKRAR